MYKSLQTYTGWDQVQETVSPQQICMHCSVQTSDDFFSIFCITSNLNEKEMNCKSFDFFYFISGIEKNIKQNQIILNNFQKQSILCKKEQLISQINMYDTQQK